MNYNDLCPHCMREVKEKQGGACHYCGHRFEEKRELRHQLKPFTVLNGKYLTGDVLGEGGFGITYIGFDLNLEIRIAVKEFYPNGFCSREAAATNQVMPYSGASAENFDKWRKRFIQEAKSLAKCAHLPGIVGVKDFFLENNTAYIVMEYLEGVTLKDYVKLQGGRLPFDRLMISLEPVMVSLAQVHSTGLIHRDISPDNIMLTEDGSMKLLDFGAARDFTNENEKSLSVMLKPGYAPEEQYRTKGKQGPWSDVYAFAATIYKCITGVTPPESMERMRQDELKRPGALGAAISAEKESVLLKGMSVYAEQRYQSMAAFHQALFASGGGRPSSGPMVRTTGQRMEQSEKEMALVQAPPVEKQPASISVPAGKKTMTGSVTTGKKSAAGPVVVKRKKQYGMIMGLAVCFLAAVLLIIQGRRAENAVRKEMEPAVDKTVPVVLSADGSAAEALTEPEAGVMEDVAAGEDELPVHEESPAVTEDTLPEQEINTYRYEILIDDVTWYEAYEDCMTRGGHLVTIESQEEFEILAAQLTEQGYEKNIFWLGGMRELGSSEYHWIDAEGTLDDVSLNRAQEFKDYWLAGEPSYTSAGEEERYMMSFYKSDLERWVWNDAPEDLIAAASNYAGKIGYICEY